MAEVLIQSIICFLAIFGLIQMCIKIYDALTDINIKKEDIYIIITVKNQQDTIEGIVRSLVWKSLNNKHGGLIPRILIIDLGSTDDTLEILKRLNNEYNFIEITDTNGYIKVLEKLIQ